MMEGTRNSEFDPIKWRHDPKSLKAEKIYVFRWPDPHTLVKMATLEEARKLVAEGKAWVDTPASIFLKSETEA